MSDRVHTPSRKHGLKGLITLLGASYKHAPWATVGALVLYPIARLESVVVALGLRRIIDAALSGSARFVFMGIVTVVAGVSIMYIIDQIAWRLCLRLEDVVGHALDRRTAELVADTPGIEHFERPEYLDRVEILREQGWMLGRYLYSLPMTWGDLARSVATIAILGSIHPLLFLLPLFGLPALFTESKADTISRKAEEASAEDLRRSRTLFELSVRPDTAKEIRIFRLREWLFESHRLVWARVRATLSAARLKSALFLSIGWILFACAFIASMVFVMRLALAGSASLGDLVLALTLGVRVGGEVSSMAREITYLKRISRLGSHLAWIESYARHIRARSRGRRVFSGISEGIRFDNVSFRYTGASGYALKDVSISLEPGSTIALVGQNGAGKTTLVKLLCRMYEPSGGTICIDGIPLSEFTLDSWLGRITAAFQDFARFEVTAQETVGIGDVPRMEDNRAVQNALERADADTMVASFPNGLGTMLGGSWQDGHEPSIGQWQKLAIARYAMREGPSLYILDEPTAGLDPQTEHQVFERHREIVSQGPPGSITLLVSHRFSTVSMADEIVVLNGGSVVEVGSHDELMKSDGYYARFFKLQRNAFDPQREG